MKDNISDMIIRIKNGQRAKLKNIYLFWPISKVCIQILNVMQKEGFILGYTYENNENKIKLNVFLKYTLEEQPIIHKINRISKIGQRIFIKSKMLWKANVGKGIYILSTPKGIMSDGEARFLNLGGEILVYIE